MQLYELTYLIKPEVGEVQSFCEKINSFIQEQGGILERATKSKTTNLAYQIKKGNQYFKTAFLCSLNFYLDPQKLKNLEEKLKKEEDILRLSFFKRKLKKSSGLSKRDPGRRKLLPEKSKKVELKEIEEKIKEILEE